MKTAEIYKQRLLAALVVLAYATMRITFNSQYDGATWKQLFNFTAAKPFAMRVMIPLLGWPIQHITQWPAMYLVYIFEVAFSAALFWILIKLFLLLLPPRQAFVASLAFFFVLPLQYLLNFAWPVLMPYDTAAIFFTALGLYTILQQRWRILLLIMVLATLNRESAILLPLTTIILATDFPDFKRRTVIAIFCGVIYVVIRSSVIYIFRNSPGMTLPFMMSQQDTTHFCNNALWLRQPVNALQFMGYLSFLPLIWFFISNYIPRAVYRIKYVALFYFAVLSIFGNFYEPRVFGEMTVLIYVPCVLGLSRWMQHQPAFAWPKQMSVLQILERWGVMGLILIYIMLLPLISVSFGCYP